MIFIFPAVYIQFCVLSLNLSVPDILMLPVPGTVASSILLQKKICDWMEEWRRLAVENCDIAEGNPEYPSPKVARLPYFFV